MLLILGSALPLCTAFVRCLLGLHKCVRTAILYSIFKNLQTTDFHLVTFTLWNKSMIVIIQLVYGPAPFLLLKPFL
jgi:hypothetical protein